MAVSYVEAEEMKLNPPPSTEMVLKRMNEYCNATGMEANDLAHEIGYSPVALQHFRAGTYAKLASTDIYLRHALAKYFDQHPAAGVDDDVPTKLLMTRDTKMILARAREAQRAGRIIVVEGPPGTSKTTAFKSYAAKNRSQSVIYMRCWMGISPVAMLREICRLTGARANASRDRLLKNCIRRLRALKAADLENRSALLLIDECQYLLGASGEALEQLRDVLDLAKCGCVLAGHFNFLRTLSNGHGKFLEQWLSRIDLHEHLRGLEEKEIPSIAHDYLGEALPASVISRLVKFARVRDRNFAWRNQLAHAKFAQAQYLSIRRVHKFLARLEELRQIPENAGRSYAELAPAVAELMMQPEAEAL